MIYKWKKSSGPLSVKQNNITYYILFHSLAIVLKGTHTTHYQIPLLYIYDDC